MTDHPGRLIYTARVRAGLSQREAAEALNMSPSSYNRLENGSTNSIPLKLLPRIRRAFGQSLDQIFTPDAVARDAKQELIERLKADPKLPHDITTAVIDAIFSNFQE